jgi:hypothetical protein
VVAPVQLFLLSFAKPVEAAMVIVCSPSPESAPNEIDQDDSTLLEFLCSDTAPETSTHFVSPVVVMVTKVPPPCLANTVPPTETVLLPPMTTEVMAGDELGAAAADADAGRPTSTGTTTVGNDARAATRRRDREGELDEPT